MEGVNCKNFSALPCTQDLPFPNLEIPRKSLKTPPLANLRARNQFDQLFEIRTCGKAEIEQK